MNPRAPDRDSVSRTLLECDPDEECAKKKRKRRRRTDEGSYVCPTCGEQIVIPVDPTGGAEQEYGEDCPVCCNPNIVHVEFFGPANRRASGPRRSEENALNGISARRRRKTLRG
jgi:hypothetical protein